MILKHVSPASITKIKAYLLHHPLMRAYMINFQTQRKLDESRDSQVHFIYTSRLLVWIALLSQVENQFRCAVGDWTAMRNSLKATAFSLNITPESSDHIQLPQLTTPTGDSSINLCRLYLRQQVITKRVIVRRKFP